MDGYHVPPPPPSPPPPASAAAQATMPRSDATSAETPPQPSHPNKSAATSPNIDTFTLAYMKTLTINHFRSRDVPWRSMGQYQYRIIEDGSNTQDRLSVVESAIPPKSHGPIFHFHEMHDETFYVTEGAVRFHAPGHPPIDAQVGDMVVVPTRMPHRFSNPFGKTAKFVSTNTPSHYARYFYHLEYLIGAGNKLTPEVNKEAMKRFATIPLSDEDLELLEKELAVGGPNDDDAKASEGDKAPITNGHAGLANGVNGHAQKEGGEGWVELD